MINWIKNLFKKKQPMQLMRQPMRIRSVKTSSGMSVELLDDQPDALAEMMAQVFESGKPMSGTVDEHGKLDVKVHDNLKDDDWDGNDW